ncbi:SulP family inorganic anion transporter [Virgibacillus oceani]
MGFNRFSGSGLSPFNTQQLTGDITSGIIVVFLLLPQSMAYAQIAGVPVVMGLYAAAFPLITYALIGNSRYLSIGPVSIVSLLTFSGVSSIAEASEAQFLELVILLALLVGIIQVLFGILRFGSFFHYVPAALIRGFISAVAIIIIFNQLGALLGITLPGYENLFSHMNEILRHVMEINMFTVGIGLGSIFLLLICKKIIRPSPGPFIVFLFSIILVDFFNLDVSGVDIVGEIPIGELTLNFLLPAWDKVFMLLSLAFVISLISFVESYAVAGSLAIKDGDKENLNPNRELIGLGAANMTSSFVGAIPVAGAISRSAVAYQSGAKTKLALFITAGFMLVSIYFITPLFYYLPTAALAAIIILAVANLIGVKEFLYDCRYRRIDATIFLITFLAVLFVDVFLGFVIGICFSFVVRAFIK